MFELSQQNCCRPKLFSCVSAFLETNSNVPVKYFQGWSVCLDLFVSWCFKPSQPLRITSGLICLDNSNRPYRFDKLWRVFFFNPKSVCFLVRYCITCNQSDLTAVRNWTRSCIRSSGPISLEWSSCCLRYCYLLSPDPYHLLLPYNLSILRKKISVIFFFYLTPLPFFSFFLNLNSHNICF